MTKFVSLRKRSKKEQKAYYAAQRSSWGTVKPYRQVHKSKRDYNRTQSKRELRKELPLFYHILIKAGENCVRSFSDI